MHRQLAMLFMSGAIALLSALAQAETLNVRLVLSDNSPPYQQFSVALNKALATSKADVNVIASQVSDSTNADLVIAVGIKASESTFANIDVPVLGVMIPKTSYELLLGGLPAQQRSKAVSAIYIDQPWERQLDFIQAALPKHRKIGLLYSPDTRLDLASLRNSTKQRGLQLSAQSVQTTETLFATLDTVLGESDVLLVIPDNAIYNSSNVRNILLTSYRHKVALIGISQAYVNAGAIGAIFSTPEHLAEQTAATIISFAKSRRLPEPQYPDLYSIALNQQVAHSLGIALNTPESVRERISKAEKGRR